MVVTTATEVPEEGVESPRSYTAVFGRLGVSAVRELRAARPRRGRQRRPTLRTLDWATGVLFSGGDQSRIRTLVGSRTNELLKRRLDQQAWSSPGRAPARPPWATG